MWMACYTQQEIADATGIAQQSVARKIESITQNGKASEMGKTLTFEKDSDFTPPPVLSY